MNHLIENIKIARETLRIVREGRYRTSSGREVMLPSPSGYGTAEVIDTRQNRESVTRRNAGLFPCRFSVVAQDTFEAARRIFHPVVLSFANAFVPGGAFLLGSGTQEESLCRRSALYAAISSREAKGFYSYSRTHPVSQPHGRILYVGDVCVFRGTDNGFLEKPYVVDVVSAAAPNRRGFDCLLSRRRRNEVIIDRIRAIAFAAAFHGRRSLVLGAWGCGAFGNLPEDVAACFRRVLVDEGLCSFFDEVVFAIHGGENSRNFVAFQNAFSSLPETQKAVGIMRQRSNP